MKGYKGFERDMTCRGMQYEVGKTYRMDEPPDLCKRGYHFCDTLRGCTEFYDLGTSVFCEVEATGIVVGDEQKRATNELSIVRQLTQIEVGRLYYGNGDGYGYGNGNGNGNGYGNGNGNGYGYGNGNGNGNGYGYGNGYGNGYGYGNGNGYGNGYGDGNGDGNGDGYGNGYGYGYGKQKIQNVLVFKEDE